MHGLQVLGIAEGRGVGVATKGQNERDLGGSEIVLQLDYDAGYTNLHM